MAASSFETCFVVRTQAGLEALFRAFGEAEARGEQAQHSEHENRRTEEERRKLADGIKKLYAER